MRTAVDEATVAEVGEFDVIRRLVGERPPAADRTVLLDTGDDAAVLSAADSRVVTCTDMLVEGRHFRLDWSAPADVGGKAIAQNAADIAAMGGGCTGFLVAIGCPPSTPVRVLEEISAGARAEAARAGAAIVGGDLVQARQLVLSVTALGTLDGRRAVRRAGARPSDVLAVCGGTGASAAGLALLQAGWGMPGCAVALDDAVAARLIAAHVRPRPPYAAGPQAAAAGATAMIDVSDGLAADLGHIAEDSGVVLRVDPARLRGDAGGGAGFDDLRSAADAFGADPWEWVLGGGEDHPLAATFPAAGPLPEGWRAVGTVHAPGDAPAGSGRTPAEPAVLFGDSAYGGAPGWVAFGR
ncbi:thiamine-phosphate kinase [Tomitella cavernea]|uniref:thiamine-phosphate kinase n=1 Tax=Tomitella cavernea TaxID=1387982 RepID=UPI001905CA06|nr:thiamine-phosphate kinase [Tomitella cavernea]